MSGVCLDGAGKLAARWVVFCYRKVNGSQQIRERWPSEGHGLR
jgi:hypothetical protein